MTMTPKEALVKDGFPVKEGRGRLSREAIERCKVLAAQGWSIKGYEVKAASSSTAAPVVEKVKAVAGVKEVKEFTIHFPQESFKAVYANGKPVGTPEWGNGMREVCDNCRVSFVQCLCLGDNKTLFGNVVKVVPL